MGSAGARISKQQKQTLKQLQENIPREQLPLTLRQVLDLVRRLGIQHLWIDALCIVQDDESDKATEIGKMADVYSNATLQISAMASHGAAYELLPTTSVPHGSHELEGTTSL